MLCYERSAWVNDAPNLSSISIQQLAWPLNATGDQATGDQLMLTVKHAKAQFSSLSSAVRVLAS